MPASTAAARSVSSPVLSSTPNALVATITRTPSAFSSSTAARALSGVSASVVRNRCPGRRKRPGASSISLMLLWPRARTASTRLAVPMTPTEATSPSSRALVAWVVLCARKITSLGSTLERSRTFRKTSTTPLATPRSSAWVVSTE